MATSDNKHNGIKVVSIKMVKEKTLFPNHSILQAQDAVQLLRDRFAKLDRESLFALNVDVQGTVTCMDVVSIGTVNSTLFSPRDIYKSAILSNSSGIILLHNHPSGNPKPSDEDLLVTRRMIKSSKIMDIRLLDHIIVAGGTGDYYSFREHGELDDLYT